VQPAARRRDASTDFEQHLVEADVIAVEKPEFVEQIRHVFALHFDGTVDAAVAEAAEPIWTNGSPWRDHLQAPDTGERGKPIIHIGAADVADQIADVIDKAR